MHDKETEQVLKEIDSLSEISKQAYTKLYSRVGEEIGAHFIERLEKGGVDPILGIAKQTEFEKALQEANGSKQGFSRMA